MGEASHLRSDDVIGVLEQLFEQHGAPRHLRSDNGPEFVANAVQTWLAKQNVNTAYVEPGKPWQNGLAESVNSRFWAECLNAECFSNRTDTKVSIETWRKEYNEAS